MKKTFLLLAVILLLTNYSLAEQATYEGGKRCRTCHMNNTAGMIYEKWEITEHAQAYHDLSEEDRKNPVCLKCHTTGYNEPASPGIMADDLLGVQCEACHGAASSYKHIEIMNEDAFRKNFSAQRKKSIEAGLVIPTEETCKRCHNQESPHYKPFVYRMAYPKIKHLVPRRYLGK